MGDYGMRIKDFSYTCSRLFEGGKSGWKEKEKKMLLGLMMKRRSHSRVAIFSKQAKKILLALNCIIFKEC